LKKDLGFFVLTMGKWEEIRPACNLDVFNEVAKQFKKLYVAIVADGCVHCTELKKKMRETQIPHPIVEVPGDVCFEIADDLNVDRYPTVCLLEKGKVKSKHIGNVEKIIERMRAGQ